MAVKFTTFCERTGLDLTEGQLIVSRVAFDGEEPENVAGAEAFFGPVKIVPPRARRVFVAVCGARGGKTRVFLANRSLHAALTVPLKNIAPGEEVVAPFVAPTLKLAKQGFRYARGVAEHVPKLARRIVHKSTESMTLRRDDGFIVRIECAAAGAGGAALRGQSLTSVAMDEAAFFRDETSGVVNDREIVNAARPRIVPDGQIVIASTPYLSTGVLYEYWKTEFGNPQRALVAHAPTRLLNPQPNILEQLEEEYEHDPENAEREFGAKFLAVGSSTFFDHGQLDRAADSGVTLGRAAQPKAELAAAADMAFRSDTATLAIVERNGREVAVLELDEQQPEPDKPLKPSEVVARMAAILKRHGVETVAVDQFYIESIRELFAEHGIVVIEAPPGNVGKAEVYTLARDTLREGRLKLPRHPRLLAELRLVASKALSGGGIVIHSPRRSAGGHGDLASALTLAIWALGRYYEPEVTEPEPARHTEEWVRREIERNRRRVQQEVYDDEA